MEMTLPCSEHQLKDNWYKPLAPAHLRYGFRQGRILLLRKSYAKRINERRREEYYARVFSGLFIQGVQTVFESENAVANELSLEQRFREQADKWERETRHISSVTKRVMHPSYQTIIGMGPDVVPLLIRDLRQNRRAWFWALSHITGVNPINPADAGKMDKMIMAWVNWATEKGLL